MARSAEVIEALARELGAPRTPSTCPTVPPWPASLHGSRRRSVDRHPRQQRHDLRVVRPRGRRRDRAAHRREPPGADRAVSPGGAGDGRPQPRHIVNVSSMAGVIAMPGMATYGATKAGLSHFSAILRAELRETGVSVSSIELGPVTTGMLDDTLSYGPTREGFARAYRLRLVTNTTPERVAERVLGAMKRDEPSACLPRRATPFAMLASAARATLASGACRHCATRASEDLRFQRPLDGGAPGRCVASAIRRRTRSSIGWCGTANGARWSRRCTLTRGSTHHCPPRLPGRAWTSSGETRRSPPGQTRRAHSACAGVLRSQRPVGRRRPALRLAAEHVRRGARREGRLLSGSLRTQTARRLQETGQLVVDVMNPGGLSRTATAFAPRSSFDWCTRWSAALGARGLGPGVGRANRPERIRRARCSASPGWCSRRWASSGSTSIRPTTTAYLHLWNVVGHVLGVKIAACSPTARARRDDVESTHPAPPLPRDPRGSTPHARAARVPRARTAGVPSPRPRHGAGAALRRRRARRPARHPPPRRSKARARVAAEPRPARAKGSCRSRRWSRVRSRAAGPANASPDLAHSCFESGRAPIDAPNRASHRRPRASMQ